jgi:hypothetical protein
VTSVRRLVRVLALVLSAAVLASGCSGPSAVRPTTGLVKGIFVDNGGLAGACNSVHPCYVTGIIVIEGGDARTYQVPTSGSFIENLAAGTYVAMGQPRGGGGHTCRGNPNPFTVTAGKTSSVVVACQIP